MRDGEVVYVSIDNDAPAPPDPPGNDVWMTQSVPESDQLIDELRVRAVSEAGVPANTALLDNFVFTTYSGPVDEPGMEGIAFDLYYLVQTYFDPSGTVPQFEWGFQDRTFTDEHGNFWFTGLDPGKVYQVRENLAASDMNNNGIPDDEEGVHATTDDVWTTPEALMSGQEYVSWNGHSVMVVDGATAVLASFGVTPTTQLPYADFVPWRSRLFLTHILLATIGFFGFIGIVIMLWIRGTRLPYPRLRVFQFRVLLPVWLVGEGIALVNALVKAVFRIRIYDYL